MRVAPLEATAHQFSVGQIVRIKGRSGGFPKADAVFRITATLPTRDNFPQYRVRSDRESHERVAAEDALELVGPETAVGAVPAPTAGTGRTSAGTSNTPPGAGRTAPRAKTRK
jgi:hypothetical protein